MNDELRNRITDSPSEEEILSEYNGLTQEDIQACRLYAEFAEEDRALAEMGMNEFVRILEEEDNAKSVEDEA